MEARQKTAKDKKHALTCLFSHFGVSFPIKRTASCRSVEFTLANLTFAYSPIIYTTLMQGTVKSLNEKKFGFISVEGEEKDIFFHESALVGMVFGEVRIGDVVTFDTEQSDKGPRAVNVQRA